jgi:pimeloyl-ACP methyl ester carboxylesterase
VVVVAVGRETRHPSRHLVARMADEGYAVLVYDMRGFGQSSSFPGCGREQVPDWLSRDRLSAWWVPGPALLARGLLGAIEHAVMLWARPALIDATLCLVCCVRSSDLQAAVGQAASLADTPNVLVFAHGLGALAAAALGGTAGEAPHTASQAIGYMLASPCLLDPRGELATVAAVRLSVSCVIVTETSSSFMCHCDFGISLSNVRPPHKLTCRH